MTNTKQLLLDNLCQVYLPANFNSHKAPAAVLSRTPPDK
jgi:hypothetical protein